MPSWMTAMLPSTTASPWVPNFLTICARTLSRIASAEAIRDKVRAQIVKKFGNKGDAVVEGNMAVIHDGIEATHVVDYDQPAFHAIDAEPNGRVVRTTALSASMCPTAGDERATPLFDPAYYEDLVARPFREGTISEAPVLPGVGLFMPVGTGATKDKGIFRRTVPSFDPALCTGCLECALVCPDVAIPNTVHEIHDLLLMGIREIDVTEPQREALRAQVYPWAERIRELYRQDKSARAFSDVVVEAASVLDTDQRAVVRNVDKVVAQLATYPVARTPSRRRTAGSGALFAATVHFQGST